MNHWPQELNAVHWKTFGRNETAEEIRQKWEEQCARVELFSIHPTILLVLNSRPSTNLASTVASIKAQSYPQWRCASTERHNDDRFYVASADSDVAFWKSALQSSDEEWVGFVDAGDVLSPVALYRAVLELHRAPAASFLFADESWPENGKDRVLSKGRFSSFNLRHWNSVGRFWMARRRELLTVLESSNARSEHELLQKYCEAMQGPALHNPEVWYYRERAPLSHEFPAALPVAPPGRTEGVKLSVVICFRDRPELTLQCLRSVVRVSDPSVEIVLVDNDSSPETLQTLQAGLKTISHPVLLRSHPGKFNFGRMNTWAVQHCTSGEVVLFLNNDVELKSVDLRYWAKWAAQPGVGTVGIQLQFPDGRVQHSGIRATFGGQSRLARTSNSHRNDELTGLNREVFANTFAACMTRRSVFEELGGLNTQEFANGFGDIAYCFEARRRGLTNLYLGSQVGTHRESSSRGQSYEFWEEVLLSRRYSDVLSEMLLEDSGFDRFDSGRGAVFREIREAISSWARRKAWLDPWKPRLKKWWNLCIPGTRELEV